MLLMTYVSYSKRHNTAQCIYSITYTQHNILHCITQYRCMTYFSRSAPHNTVQYIHSIIYTQHNPLHHVTQYINLEELADRVQVCESVGSEWHDAPLTCTHHTAYSTPQHNTYTVLHMQHYMTHTLHSTQYNTVRYNISQYTRHRMVDMLSE